MKVVNFTQMKDGSKDEYLLLDQYEQNYIKGTADRVLKFMGGLNSTLEGYKITRLEHSLQTATRAYKDKADEIIPKILKCMANPLTVHGRQMIIPSDCEIGTNWKDMKKYVSP